MADLNLPRTLEQDSRILLLPYEIFLLVAELLSLRSWNALARTCRHLYSVLTPSLYSIAVSMKNGQGDVFKWAAGKGCLATIHRLMDYAPEGYVNCVRGEVALRQAARAGQTEIIRWLLDYGVDPYGTRTRKDDFTSSGVYICKAPPVLIAARSGHTEAAELLLDAMPDFNYVRFLEESPVIEFVRNKQTTLLESILRRGIDVDQRDGYGETALFHAVRRDHIPSVAILLEFGADINASSSARQVTPLFVAAEKGLEAVMELLLQRGARVDMTEYPIETSLHVAISANSIKAVSLLIEHGANVNAIDSSQKTALERSISDGVEAEMLKLLLDAGADFTIPNAHGDTPVKWAWIRGAKEKVRLLLNAREASGAAFNLLESPTTLLHAAIYAQHDLAHRLLAQGADVDKLEMTTRGTALMEAAKQEEDSLFDLVLQKSLDVNVSDPYGQTALSVAAEHGSEHKVRSLLNKNASAEIYRWDTPMTYAAKNHHLQVVLLLLQQTKGVDLADESLRSAVTSAVAFGDAEFLELIHEKGKLDQPDRRYGDTVLHRAARRGDLAIVKWLLNQAVGINVAGYRMQTPLMLAVYSRNTEVVEQLLQHGARLDARDVNHATALHWALPHWTNPSFQDPRFDPILGDARCRLPVNVDIVKILVDAGADLEAKINVDIVKILVDAGADLEAKNAMDETPLTRAAINGSISAVRLLLEKGANVESRDKSGFVPLLLAAREGHTDVVCLLLEHGAMIDFANADGDTAVILAADNGHHETTSSLLARSAEINRVNHAHRTALSCAAEKGHDKVVEVLLQNGAEVDLPDHTGRTPLLWAVQNEHERCVELLVQGCADVTRGDAEGRTPLWWVLNRDQKSSESSTSSQKSRDAERVLKRAQKSSESSTSSQKSRDTFIRILYDRHPACS